VLPINTPVMNRVVVSGQDITSQIADRLLSL
jgi:hypothetical protein